VFGCIKLWFNRRHYLFRNLVLQHKYICKLAIVTFSRDVIAGHRIYELGSNANTVPALPHASFENVSHT
jgi:hypothetical protein